ncbi:MAG: hypothetical protein RSB99_04000 [Bacilli bacterium]
MPASVLAVFTQFLVQPIINKLSNLYYDYKIKEMNKDISYLNLILIVIGIGLSLIAYFMGPEVLGFIYGVNLTAFRLPLSLIIIAGIASGIIAVYSTILTIMRKMNIQIILCILSFVITLVLSLVLVQNSVSNAFICLYYINDY